MVVPRAARASLLGAFRAGSGKKSFLPQKGGAVPESEKRRAAWRTTEPSHTWVPPLLSHLLISFPPGRGSGRARGAVWRVRVCDCDGGPLARDHWVCIINNEGALKKKKRSNQA